MARISPKLFEALTAKTGLSKQQIYKRIQQISSEEYLPRHLAAIKFGAESGVPINKYANAEELGHLRQAGTPVAPPGMDTAIVAAKPAARPSQRAPNKKPTRSPPNQVFVVHGRDYPARDSIYSFLRSIGVKPIEWNTAIAMSKKAAPYIGQILDAGFNNARAVLVLFTPDDLVKLRPDLLSKSDPPYERREVGQARPNVLFEAGRAFASHPDRTVMVQLGSVRPFSDVFGRHVVHLTNDAARRRELATKLENAGCNIDTSGTDWLTAGDFTDPESRKPQSKNRRK